MDFLKKLYKNIIHFLQLTRELNMELDLWEAQNIFYDIYKKTIIKNNITPEHYSALQELGQELGFI